MPDIAKRLRAIREERARGANQPVAEALALLGAESGTGRKRRTNAFLRGPPGGTAPYNVSDG